MFKRTLVATAVNFASRRCNCQNYCHQIYKPMTLVDAPSWCKSIGDRACMKQWSRQRNTVSAVLTIQTSKRYVWMSPDLTHDIWRPAKCITIDLTSAYTFVVYSTESAPVFKYSWQPETAIRSRCSFRWVLPTNELSSTSIASSYSVASQSIH